MERFREGTSSLILFGVLLIILGLGSTVFKEDKVEDTLRKAVIKLPNNEIVTGEVEEWTTYDNKDTVKVKLKNGKQYLGHSSDIVLYND